MPEPLTTMSDLPLGGGPARGGDGVAGGLVRSSTSFARSAISAYAAESLDVYYLHLATAVEHLVKGVLAGVHPSFIADPRGGFDSLLHLSGMGDRAVTPNFVGAVQTITITEALKRVARVVDDYKEPGAYVAVLLEARNGIVHAGQTPGQEGGMVLGDVARYVPTLLAAIGLSEADYWGDAADLVAQHAQRRLNEIEALFERQLQAARDRYASVIKHRPKVALAAFLAAVEPRGPADDFTSFPVTCPACERQGILSGTPEPEWEPDWDYADGQSYIAGMYVDSITLRTSGFECPVCRLTLEDATLELAGLDTVTFRDAAFDSHLAYAHFRRIEAEDWGR